MNKTTHVLIAFAIITAPLAAATVTYEFGGSISRLLDYRGDNLLPVSAGDPFFGTFSLDLDTPVKFNAPRTAAIFWGMITDVDLHIGGLDLAPTGNPLYPGYVSMHNDFDSGLGDILDDVVFQTPELQTGENTVYRASFILRDWTAGLIDDLPPLNAANVEFLEHDNDRDHQRLLFVDLQPGGGPSMIIDWQTFELQPISGDANLDGQVTAYDLNVVVLNWHLPADWSGGDFTGDGFVDAADLNELGLNWRQSITPAAAQAAAIPEPSGAALTVLALSVVACLRRRTRDT